MSVVNLSNLEQFSGGANFHTAINPEFAMSLGRDVIDLSTLQPDAFYYPPITEKGASQPVNYQLIKMAWLSLDSQAEPATLLDPELEQTKRILEYADMVDKAFDMETKDRYVLLYNRKAVLFAHDDLGQTAVNTNLLGTGSLLWHDYETKFVLEQTEMTLGDIIVVNGNVTHSVTNSDGPRVVLVQTLQNADFSSPVSM